MDKPVGMPKKTRENRESLPKRGQNQSGKARKPRPTRFFAGF
jgi:hypothetical protein